MSGTKHLIKLAFPLKQVSLDAVQEKNPEHEHISTVHVCPVWRRQTVRWPEPEASARLR